MANSCWSSRARVAQLAVVSDTQWKNTLAVSCLWSDHGDV